MGLTTWKNAPKGRIRKSDVTVAKNYLNETEMRNLNEIVTMYLDYAERQAHRGNVMYMADWVKRLDAIHRKPTPPVLFPAAWAFSVHIDFCAVPHLRRKWYHSMPNSGAYLIVP